MFGVSKALSGDGELTSCVLLHPLTAPVNVVYILLCAALSRISECFHRQHLTQRLIWVFTCLHPEALA